MGTETDILTAIFTKLDDTNVAPGAWPNVPYDGETPYVRYHSLPAGVESIGLSGIDFRTGLVQVDCVVDAGVGMIAASTLADEVIAAFPRNTKLVSGSTTVMINQACFVGPGMQEPDHYFIPISIPYEVIT